MSSTSETARAALAAALAPAFAAAGYDGFARNVAALSDLRPAAAGGDMFATVRDAETEIDGEPFSPNGYDLLIRSQVELVVVDADDARRDATFDAALIMIDDALEVDRTLGGAVAHVQIERIDPVDIAIEGAEGVKAALVLIRMLAFSARPF